MKYANHFSNNGNMQNQQFIDKQKIPNNQIHSVLNLITIATCIIVFGCSHSSPQQQTIHEIREDVVETPSTNTYATIAVPGHLSYLCLDNNRRNPIAWVATSREHRGQNWLRVIDLKSQEILASTMLSNTTKAMACGDHTLVINTYDGLFRRYKLQTKNPTLKLEITHQSDGYGTPRLSSGIILINDDDAQQGLAYHHLEEPFTTPAQTITFSNAHEENLYFDVQDHFFTAITTHRNLYVFDLKSKTLNYLIKQALDFEPSALSQANSFIYILDKNDNNLNSELYIYKIDRNTTELVNTIKTQCIQQIMAHPDGAFLLSNHSTCGNRLSWYSNITKTVQIIAQQPQASAYHLPHVRTENGLIWFDSMPENAGHFKAFDYTIQNGQPILRQRYGFEAPSGILSADFHPDHGLLIGTACFGCETNDTYSNKSRVLYFNTSKK